MHQAPKKREKMEKTAFEPAAVVGGTSSIGMFYLQVTVEPAASCYPLSAISFLLSPTAVSLLFLLLPPLPAFALSGFLPLLSCCLPSPHSLGHHAHTMADARRCLLSGASSSCHLTMNRSAASRTPRYRFPALMYMLYPYILVARVSF